MKRYILFAWNRGDRGHGWQNQCNSYDSIDDALDISGHWDFYQIVDTESKFDQPEIIQEYVEWMIKPETQQQ